MFLRFFFVVLLFAPYCKEVVSYPCIFREKIKESTFGQKIVSDGMDAVMLGDSAVTFPDDIFQQKMELNAFDVVPSLRSTINSTTDKSSLNVSLDKKKRQTGDDLSVTELSNALDGSKLADSIPINNARSSDTSNDAANRWSLRAILRRLKSFFISTDTKDTNISSSRNKRSIENPLENDDVVETSDGQDRSQPEEYYDDLVAKDLETMTTSYIDPRNFKIPSIL